MMTPKERAAMQQALEALEEMFHSNSTKVAVEKYNIAHNALREALDNIPDAPKMVGCAYCNNPLFAGTKCNNCGLVTLAEQAEQEPVSMFEWQNGNPVGLRKAAPVRTKDPCNPLQDLTDDEIVEAVGVLNGFDAFRAVIAAYKEKNK